MSACRLAEGGDGTISPETTKAAEFGLDILRKIRVRSLVIDQTGDTSGTQPLEYISPSFCSQYSANFVGVAERKYVAYLPTPNLRLIVCQARSARRLRLPCR